MRNVRSSPLQAGLAGRRRRLGAACLLALAPAAALAQAPAGGEAAPSPSQIVVVTATRTETLAIDAPASLSVVTRRDIEARGADNVLDAIRTEPGLTLQGRAVGGRKVIAMRGLDSRHTLYLVNGQRVNASDGVVGASDFQYDWIASEDIQRIEVVRGPLSVLYGSEALGGVVNVITREVGDSWRFGGMAEGSTATGDRGGDGHRAAVRADGPLGGGMSLRAGAAVSRLDALASPVDPRLSELEGRDKTDGWLALGWRGAGSHRVDLEHRAGREERDAAARERGGARRYHETLNHIDRSMSSLGWRAGWATPLATEPLNTLLRAYRSTLEVENTRTAGVAVNPPQTLEDTVYEGQADLPLPGLALTSGFELRDESLQDPGLPDGRASVRHRALYAQGELPLAEGLRLTAGLRHDHHEVYGSQWSPRAYLVWRAGPAWTVKGGYGRGFRAPNLKQIVPGARAEGPNIVIGNPDLGPETSSGLEAAVGWASGASQWQLTVFDQTVDNLIELLLLRAGPAPGTGTYTYSPVAEAKLRGVETSLWLPLGAGFSTQLSYSYLDARNGDDLRLDRRPRHTLVARLNWESGPWRAGLVADRVDDQRLPSTTPGAPSQEAPAIELFDAYLVRKLPAGWELTLGVNNLTDLRLADESPLFTQVERPRTWRLALRGAW
jgi:outer membrane receptor for ferrienterochelin and colicins